MPSIFIYFSSANDIFRLSFSSSSLHERLKKFYSLELWLLCKKGLIAFASVKYVRHYYFDSVQISCFIQLLLNNPFSEGKEKCVWFFRDSSFAHAFLFFFFHNEEEATRKAIFVFCKFVIILLYCSLDFCSVFQHLVRRVFAMSVFREWRRCKELPLCLLLLILAISKSKKGVRSVLPE